MILKDINEMFADDLRDPSYAAGYLNITLEEDGIEGFLYALQKVARAHGMGKVALNSDMPRESLYRALSDKGNPSVKTLTRVLDSLGLRLTVTASVQQSCMANEDPAEDQVTSMRLRMEEEFAVMCERAQVQQEEARRATLALQKEASRILDHMQQLTAMMTEQMRPALESGRQAYRVQTERNTTYSFPTRPGKQVAADAELYRENPLALVKVAA